ncbi:hypothetical protein Dsin_008161 [Dipteronia sinensis]|uniref:Uncharacterized protein n=1 Tax=Dipteronia sinensis TaxID=43782 RepID=A0AAE0B2Y0_9ROSI|nr:hypothetical protein Dsin_008157 [Dipteronia sinensis]KAK3228299.1 hypothetical protein Dsin_008161 [Dipteronia sinensis]
MPPSVHSIVVVTDDLSFHFRLQMHEKAVKLYAELAEVAVNSFLISKDSPVVEPVRIHNGAEENKGALRKSRGEEDEAFQILVYQAQKGNAGAMYRIGLFYYFGLRGLRRDRAKALSWFSKAADKGEAQSMEFLGEIYARGAGVERNYTKALEWLTLAARQELYSAYNGMGYLHVKGYGVDKKNYTKGTERDYERAAEAYKHAKSQANAQAMFNLGYMHEHGQGLPLDLHLAKRYYDQAVEIDPAAKLPVTLALSSLWIRKNYADGFLVRVIDSLPELYPKVEAWVENVLMEEGNATILTLFVCLLTVLYLRERQRRNAVPPAGEAVLPNPHNEHVAAFN